MAKNKRKSAYSVELQTLNRQNSALPVAEVLESLTDEIKRHCRKVGKWLWIEYETKPDKNTLEYIYGLGFRFNHRRQVWQHSCGVKCRKFNPKEDPRQKYGEEEVQ